MLAAFDGIVKLDLKKCLGYFTANLEHAGKARVLCGHP